MSRATDILTGPDRAPAWQEELYVDLHRHLELSMQETRTVGVIADRLEEWGYSVTRLGGGVVGVLANGPGRTVLFRADIDALPVKEATGLPYASTATATAEDGTVVDVMHACGHDVHVVAGLGAAEVLAKHRDAWSGTYVALFQPGEETAAGAAAMVEAGLAEAVPVPDVALAQHVLTAPDAGHVATAPGPVLSSAQSVRITVHGKGTHGAMPHLGVDPVLLAASITVRLQSIVAREIAPGEFGVVTVGSLRAGTTANIVPDRAVLLVNVRAYSTTVREQITAVIERVVRGECQVAGSPREPEFEYYDGFPLTDNDPAVTAAVTAAFREYFGAERVHRLDPVPASEDFSTVPDALGVPYTYWGLGGFAPGRRRVGNHNPGFAPVLEPTLWTGTEAAVVAALAYLGRED